jgi:hypothetical protein
MSAVLVNTCPHPTKFRQVWHFARAAKSIYAWKAVPPDGFVALGMMVTNTDAPPDTKSMRCLPESWVTPTKVQPVKVWDDTGAGGGKPGSIWIINSLDMLCIIPGHESPKEIFYELSGTRFFMEGNRLPTGKK